MLEGIRALGPDRDRHDGRTASVRPTARKYHIPMYPIKATL